MQEKTGEKPEKIFKKRCKQRSNAALPFHVVDILVKLCEEKKPVMTMQQLQKKILEEKGAFYTMPSIRYAVNNAHTFCNFLMLRFEKVTTNNPRSKAWAFSVYKKTLA